MASTAGPLRPGWTVTVNGTSLPLDPGDARITLLDWLRSHGLTGAKEGCAEGECGACSVLVARPQLGAGHGCNDGNDGDGGNGAAGTEWVAVNACMPPALGFAGQELVTVEGLGTPDHLHPVQAAMAAQGGSQCGYCTPGFVCSMAGEFYRRGQTLETDAPLDAHALGGNLCRCTGYRPILDALHALGSPADDDPMATRRSQSAPAPVPVSVTDAAGAGYVRPASLPEALDLLAAHPEAMPVAGATDVGVLINLAGLRPPLLVALDRLEELRVLRADDEWIEIGAGLTLTEVQTRLDGRVPLLDELLPQFASHLIRNAATLGGNLVTASPIGDTAPALLALDASVMLASAQGSREVALTDFFTGYRRCARRSDEVLTLVRLPVRPPGLTAFHKIAKRRLDDISGVAIAYHLELDGAVVTRARIGLGGVAATPIRAHATEAALTGQPWTEATADAAGAVLGGEGTPMSDLRASAAYRRGVLAASLPRLYVEQPAAAGASR